MPKKITALVRLQIPSDEHDGIPVAARSLGRRGISVTAFSKAFHAMKARDDRHVLPVIVTVYEDKSFSFVIETAREAACHKPAVAV